MKRLKMATFLICLSLAGCQTPSSEPTSNPPQQMAESAAQVQVIDQTLPAPTAIAPTKELAPTATTPPTIANPTLPPTATMTQMPTVPPTATASPVPTDAPTATHTHTPEPTLVEADTAELDPFACTPLDRLSPVLSPYAVNPAPWPRPSAYSQEIYTGSVSPKLIHIGFDVEGPPDVLEAILDVLDRRDVKTTMFIVGSWAEAYPEWVQEFDRRGHELANHSYSHSNFSELSAEAVTAELQSTEAIVKRLTGKSTKPWFRPPFGSRSDLSIETSHKLGWSTVIWSGSTEDWRLENGADEMCSTLLMGAYPGAIMYTHSWRLEIPEVMERFIAHMQAQGYTFVPLSVIMSSEPTANLTPRE